MPNNKKHHYVPRFYLKRFSINGTSIGLYNFANKITVIAANLKNQCYSDYFYGKDKFIESTLGDVEHEVSNLFSLIDKVGMLPPPGTPERLTMILYILIQYGRTKYFADALDELHDKIVKHTFGEKLESEIEGLDLDKFTIGLKEPSTVSMGMMVQTYPLLLDLGYKLLTNHTQADFVTSDNPVVMCNPFLSFLTMGSNTGVASKGLQIFFPIAPDRVILMYDRDIYRVGNNEKIVIKIENIQDIHNINVLQACSSYENIYFRKDNFDVRALHRKANPYMRMHKSGMKVFPQDEDNHRKSQLIMSYMEDIRFNPNLSFMGIRKSAKKWRSSLRKSEIRQTALVRNMKMVDAHEEFLEAIKKGKYSAVDFFQFIDDKSKEI